MSKEPTGAELLAAGERLLPHSVKVAKEVTERLATDMSPTPEVDDLKKPRRRLNLKPMDAT